MAEFFEDIDMNKGPTTRLHQIVLKVHKDRNQYRRIVFIVNSTGSGKTHTCIQLCSLLPSAYILCKSPSSDFLLNEEIFAVIRAIDAADTMIEKNRIAVCFILALEKALLRLSAEDAKKKQFSETTNNYLGIRALLASDWKELDNGGSFEVYLRQRCNTCSPESKLRLRSITKKCDYPEPKDLRVRFEEMVGSMDTLKLSSDPSPQDLPSPVVVIFDEADGLLGGIFKVEDERCPLRCIQRALEGTQLVGIFLSASSRLECIESYEPSFRSKKVVKQTASFIEMCSHDIYNDHPFFLGRPLWYKQYKHRENEDLGRLVQFATSKLLSGPIHGKSTENVLPCALFALRFGFEPVSSLCSEFVSDYLAIMVKLTRSTDKKQVAVCQWLSEPILAEVSCCTTMNIGEGSNDYTMRSVVSAVRNSITSQNVIRPSTGDRGEVVVGALLGYTLDILRGNHINQSGHKYNAADKDYNMSSSVITADKFLAALGLDAPPGSEEYRVNFTHFMRAQSTVTYDTCCEAVDRHVALYVTAGAKALDIVIPAYKIITSDGICILQILPIRVQIKNLSTVLTVAKGDVLSAGMSPRSECQPVLTGGGLEIGIVVATGTGGTNQTEEVGKAIVTPSTQATPTPTHYTRSKSASSPLSPYYAYLLSLKNESHFKVLRDYKGPNGDGSDGSSIIADLAYIAQHHVVEGIDECFTDWVDRHAKAVQQKIEGNKFTELL